MKPNKTRLLIVTLMVISLLAACRQEEAPTSTVAPTATTAPAAPVATATSAPATPTATATAQPSPTPVLPALTFNAQTVDETGTITVAAVTIDAPGWVLLRNSDGTVVGNAPLVPGSSQDIAITVDPLALGATVTAALYYDQDHVGALDLPDGDPAVLVDGDPVQATATITLDIPLPEVRAADQAVDAAGLLQIDRVIAPSAGWLAVFADDDGVPGALLAYVAVPAGRSNDVTLQLNMYQATPHVHLRLYGDAGEIGRFEPLVDPLVLAQGEPVQLELDLALPPDIFILDQPVVDGIVYVEYVIAPQDGWLAIYQDENGFPRRVIGFVFVAAGWNENLEVEVVPSLVTPQLFAHFHIDTGTPGEFDFPNTDPLLLIDNQVPPPFIFNTAPGSYLISRDQPLQEDAVLVTTVLDADGWLVAYRDDDGELGEMLGQVWVPAGVRHDVVLPLTGAAAGDTIHIVLHQDAGEPEVFDYPDGPDVPLQRAGQLLQVPITILAP